MGKRVGIYLRVSTKEQTTENQLRELRQVAERAGWEVVRVFEDAGVSGAKGRDQRPQYDALLKAVVRREVDMVAAWSVDRLGRSMQDLVAFLSDLQSHGADLLSASASARHHDALGARPIRNAGGVRRVRAGNDPGPRQRWAVPRQGEGEAPRASFPPGCHGRQGTRASRLGHGHPQGCIDAGHWRLCSPAHRQD